VASPRSATSPASRLLETPPVSQAASCVVFTGCLDGEVSADWVAAAARLNSKKDNDNDNNDNDDKALTLTELPNAWISLLVAVFDHKPLQKHSPPKHPRVRSRR
jgi:hypothetical protein